MTKWSASRQKGIIPWGRRKNNYINTLRLHFFVVSKFYCTFAWE